MQARPEHLSLHGDECQNGGSNLGTTTLHFAPNNSAHSTGNTTSKEGGYSWFVILIFGVENIAAVSLFFSVWVM